MSDQLRDDDGVIAARDGDAVLTAFLLRAMEGDGLIDDPPLDEAPLRIANDRLLRATGIRNFFPSLDALERFRHQPSSLLSNLHDRPHEEPATASRQWGDFQTPHWMALEVASLLRRIGVRPRAVLEPTFGAGSLLHAALETFPEAELFYGVEIQEKYEWALKLRLAERAAREGRSWRGEIALERDDIFTHPFPDHLIDADDLLILGNPPWVTNAELGSLRSENRPARRNLKMLHGLDAMTGRSNFDLAECVILRMLELFSARRGWLAMLCKSGVARNIIEMLPGSGFRCGDARAYTIDTPRAFGVAVDASLFVLRLGEADDAMRDGGIRCRVLPFEEPERSVRVFGWRDGKFVGDHDLYGAHAFLDGASPWVWRQGVKHDCAQVMELHSDGDATLNGAGRPADVERDWVYPLMKSSDLRGFLASAARREVIVTQRAIGDETASIRERAPRLWAYLEEHRALLDGRRSSIYRKAPPFALFGVGEYSFKPYKVAIAGLYKRPFFSLVAPIGGRPVMLDDTCYFLGFDALPEALFTATLLNHPIVFGFLDAIIFPEAKRPYTKSALMRIDLATAAARVPFHELQTLWSEHEYLPPGDADVAAYEEFRGRVGVKAKVKR